MVRDKETFTITIKYEIMKSYNGFQLTYLHLTLTNSKGQGHALFDDDDEEYLFGNNEI